MKIKNIMLLVLIFGFFTLVLGSFIGASFMENKYLKENENEVIKKNKFSNSLSMMLETGENTGQYQLTTRSTWPTVGYIFNTKLSRCENGAKVKWDDDANVVLMSGASSDKCYIYFDIHNLAIINNITSTLTPSSITVNVSVTEGTSKISKYMYSINNGDYKQSETNSYTFMGLSGATDYTVKVYVVDERGKSSSIFSKTIKTSDPTLVEYVKSQYTGTQGENGIYLHNLSLINSAGDNSYRYAGANPNNYVCFGSSANSCPTDNLYRIIGVFGDKVKLIKYDYATSELLGIDGTYSGDSLASSYSSTYKGNLTTLHWYNWSKVSNSNSWSESTLNTINLNTNFLANLEGSWKNKIANVLWKVGGNTLANIRDVAMYQVYQNEIVSPAASTTYSAKIGLMYVSDYGYAASPDYWTYLGYSSKGKNYDYRAATNENWMYMGLYDWTISRISNYSDRIFRIVADGDIYNDFASYDNAVRPSFYLNSDVNYISGSGKIDDPIRL